MKKSPRICVLSLNPAIDAEWCVDEILWEEKNMVRSERRWAGGKGANVVRWLRLLGARTDLLIPLGGRAGREMAEYLRADRIGCDIVPLREETRVNVVITDSRGRQMRFNQQGSRVNAADWRAILDRVQRLAGSVDAFVLSGSLPPGAPVSGYAQITRLVRAAGGRVFLDCDGSTLAAAVRSRPFLVKPNRHELAGWAGRSLARLAEVGEAAGALSRVTGGWILVSLGAEGAMLVNAKEGFAEHRRAEVASVRNTLGAGDATLAAAAHAAMTGRPPIDWLDAAVAGGTAATQSQPGELINIAGFRAILRKIQAAPLRSFTPAAFASRRRADRL